MAKHTHRGTCQACGNVQAVDNKTGLLAKHGYTVEWGYFEGECPGSKRLPLENERVILDDTVQALRDTADRREDLTIEDIDWVEVRGYKLEGRRRVKTSTVCRTEDEVQAANGGRTYETFKSLADSRLWSLHHSVKNLRAHADSLLKFAEQRHGQPLYVVADEEAKAAQEKAEKASRPTKASVHRVVERCNREYDNIVRDLKQPALNARDRARVCALSDLPFYLHQYRPAKHDRLVGDAAAVARIAELVEEIRVAKASLKG